MFENKVITHFPKPFKSSPYGKTSFGADLNENFRSAASLKVCKVIVLGDLCVGKTSLLNRFCRKVFDGSYRSTIGVDFQSEQINILGIPYHLQIWDTAGQERFKCIAQCYYRKARVIILVFDLSTIRTLASCKNWLRDALEVRSDTDPTPYVFLVGSKNDLLSDESCRSAEEIAESSARNLNAEFWSVSSRTGENIEELFFRAAAMSFDDDLRDAIEEESSKKSVKIGNDLISFQKNNNRPEFSRKKCDTYRCTNASIK